MIKENYKIVFFGTPKFAAIVLDLLAKSEFKPVAVVTEPDKPVGRKQILTNPPVKETALKYNIPIFQPEKLQVISHKLQELNPDLFIVAAYGRILPKNILDIPQKGALNLHPSLLPKYRGASPIQASILAGDKITGVTIISMDEKIDHGLIISKAELKITDPKIRTGQLSEELANLGGQLLLKILAKWLAGKIKPVPQEHSTATFTRRLKKEDGLINWLKNAGEIEKMTRAYWPWPTAHTRLNNKFFKIIKADTLEIKHNKKVGTIFLTDNKQLAVACGQKALILKEIQLEGRRIMTAQEFLNGHPEIIDTQL